MKGGNNMKEKLVIVGAGHLANEIVDFIKHYDLFDIVGFTVNKDRMQDDQYLGAPVYPMEDLENCIDKSEVKLFEAISWYHNMMGTREEKFNELKARGFHFANVISPRAMIWTDKIGEGNWISDTAYLGYHVEIGNNNVIRANVEHYSKIGDNCFIADMSMLAGHVTVGNRCFIGVSTVVHNRVTIGKKCVVGGGCVIKSDVPDYSLCIANNATIVQRDENTIEKYVSASHLKKKVCE